MNSHTDMSDEKLIQFYLAGNPNAIATLVELYKDRIYCSIFNMVQDKYISEEIFQDVFITIINNMLSGRTAGEGDFLQWATQIANQLCIEHGRKTTFATIADTHNFSANEETIDFSVPLAVPHTTYHDSHGKIKSMIALLPDEQREVIALNHYAGLSFKEIAGIMKCSLTTALDRMKYGLNNLQKMMTEKEIVLR
jgi:RNA polymerase sigma factor (sigma-70 family)